MSAITTGRCRLALRRNRRADSNSVAELGRLPLQALVGKPLHLGLEGVHARHDGPEGLEDALVSRAENLEEDAVDAGDRVQHIGTMWIFEALVVLRLRLHPFSQGETGKRGL
jgi:hypothetical protein